MGDRKKVCRRLGIKSCKLKGTESYKETAKFLNYFMTSRLEKNLQPKIQVNNIIKAFFLNCY